MLKLAIIFAVALGCHGVSVPSMKLDDGESPTFQDERFSFTPFYRLFTSGNSWPGILLGDSNIDTELTANIKTIILVHGHGGNSLSSLNPGIRTAIFAAQAGEPVNVISMDWEGLAANSYSLALSNVPQVADDLKDFIELISDTSTNTAGAPISRSNIQIVGFNLGAHVAGIAARKLTVRIARITGLDPSREHWGPTSARLIPTDANYVEVIHTDGGLRGNGIGEAIGQVDFFVNGGNDQPGCYNHLCSHNRAYEVFAASIGKTLMGNECDSQTQINLNRCRGPQLRMGDISNNKVRGGRIYRANTGRPPF